MCMDYVLFVFYFEGYCDHRDLAVLTHSFPTHRSSVLSSSSSAASSPVSAPPWAKQSLLSRATAGPGCGGRRRVTLRQPARSEEHTSELKSLMRISYAVFCSQKKKNKRIIR